MRNPKQTDNLTHMQKHTNIPRWKYKQYHNFFMLSDRKHEYNMGKMTEHEKYVFSYIPYCTIFLNSRLFLLVNINCPINMKWHTKLIIRFGNRCIIQQYRNNISGSEIEIIRKVQVFQNFAPLSRAKMVSPLLKASPL